MKKLFSNKKFSLSLLAIALGVGLTLTGLSGAWLYVQPEEPLDSVDITMGNMDIAVTLEADDLQDVYQPGDSAWIGSATVTNDGNIDAFVKLTFSFFDGAVALTDNNVKIEIDADDDTVSVEDGYYALYKDANDYYLSISAGATVTFDECISVELVGGETASPYKDLNGAGPNNDGAIGMNNSYMDNVYSVSLDWAATQVKSKAITAKFGVSISALTAVCTGVSQNP